MITPFIFQLLSGCKLRLCYFKNTQTRCNYLAYPDCWHNTTLDCMVGRPHQVNITPKCVCVYFLGEQIEEEVILPFPSALTTRPSNCWPLHRACEWATVSLSLWPCVSGGGGLQSKSGSQIITSPYVYRQWMSLWRKLTTWVTHTYTQSQRCQLESSLTLTMIAE